MKPRSKKILAVGGFVAAMGLLWLSGRSNPRYDETLFLQPGIHQMLVIDDQYQQPQIIANNGKQSTLRPGTYSISGKLESGRQLVLSVQESGYKITPTIESIDHAVGPGDTINVKTYGHYPHGQVLVVQTDEIAVVKKANTQENLF